MIRSDQPRRDAGKPLFTLGQTVATPGALEALTQSNQTPIEFLARHLRGDWGELCDDDKVANDNALDPERPCRILSAYQTANGTKIWIITEWDRSVTTILLPSEY